MKLHALLYSMPVAQAKINKLEPLKVLVLEFVVTEDYFTCIVLDENGLLKEERSANIEVLDSSYINEFDEFNIPATVKK